MSRITGRGAAIATLTALIACGAMLTGCSSSRTATTQPATSAPKTTDEDMAREIALSVYGKDWAEVAHPDDFISAVADTARNGCNILRNTADMDLLPLTPTADSKNMVSSLLQRLSTDSHLTEQQERNDLWVIAKHRCPQYSAALGAHYDAIPVAAH